jgi:hypothetical protein
MTAVPSIRSNVAIYFLHEDRVFSNELLGAGSATGQFQQTDMHSSLQPEQTRHSGLEEDKCASSPR